MEAAFIASEPYGPGSTAAPRGGRPKGTTSASTDPITIDDESPAVDGFTLGQVLHSIAAHPRGSTAAAEPRAQPGADDVDDEAIEADGNGSDASSLDLRQRLLKSRLLGLALEAIVQVSPLDTSFSILGLGHFEVELTPGGSGATLTDARSNPSITLGLDDQPHDYQRARSAGEKINMIGLLQNFFESPVGFMSMIGAATLLLVWGMLRLATSLGRPTIPRGGR